MSHRVSRLQQQMTDENLHERLGAAIGHQYDVEREIGRGGMSVVFRARDLRLQRPVAIKVLPPELAYDPAVRVRFTREAQTAAQLSHAHIVPIYDVGERDGIAYLVMAYVTGGNLGALLAREPRQPIGEVKRFLCEIADALAYAHNRGVIHRDIKPDNILLDRETGRSTVTDFGIARAMEAGTRLTNTGVAVGTPTYMSPEQAVGEREIDGRSDIYSLGVLAYQMLTGRLPFSAGNSLALLLKHVSERPPAIADLRPDAPRFLREAIERAMMKSPDDRWPSAAALRDSLMSDTPPAPWRGESREPVRYPSPRPESRAPDRGGAHHDVRTDLKPMSPVPPSRAAERGVDRGERRPALPAPLPVAAVMTEGPRGPIVLEQAHLVPLSAEQRADLRLWHGRTRLIERIDAMRGYFWLTLATIVAGTVATIGGLAEGIPPAILAPIPPVYMTMKLLKRGKSLREHGLRLRRVLLMPRAKWVLPTAPAVTAEAQLLKLAPREVLDGPHGAVIRRAVGERAAILELVASLSKPDRAMLPDVAPTANALVERVANLAQAIHRIDGSVDPRLLQELDARIAAAGREAGVTEDDRGLTLLRRQRGTLEDVMQHRATLVRQLESAALMLGNLRLDLVRLRSSGMQSALSDVSMATQEARALSREIGTVLEAAAEVKQL